MPHSCRNPAGRTGRALIAAAVPPLLALSSKLRSRTATIGVVGLGHVGLPLLLRFAQVGYRVVGMDVDVHKLACLRHRRSYLGHFDSEALRKSLGDNFSCTDDLSAVSRADAVVLCLPTPLTSEGQPDLSAITDTCDAMAPHLRAGQVLSLESTTYPGTTEEEIVPRLTRAGWKAGKELFFVYSPEREDPGNAEYCTQNIPKLVAGHTPTCLEMGLELYRQAIDHLVPVRSTQVAELAKLLENTQRSVNIALMNEMKGVCDAVGVDVLEVIDAAATKPFGFTRYEPGPGLGGHCLPVDPSYLTWKARRLGAHAPLIELASQVNRAMPGFVLAKLAEGLKRSGKLVKGATVLLLGLAYKRDVADVRESPAVELMILIENNGGAVAYSDPLVPKFSNVKASPCPGVSLELTPAVLRGFDAAIVCTDHSAFDYAMIAEHSRLVVDTRGVYRKPADHVIRA